MQLIIKPAIRKSCSVEMTLFIINQQNGRCTSSLLFQVIQQKLWVTFLPLPFPPGKTMCGGGEGNRESTGEERMESWIPKGAGARRNWKEILQHFTKFHNG